MNYGLMKHSSKEGTENLRRKLRDRIKHNIDKVDGITGSFKVALKQSVLSDVNLLEKIALQKGQKYYEHLHDSSVLKMYCLDKFGDQFVVLATTVDAAYNIVLNNGADICEEDKVLFKEILIEQGKVQRFKNQK